MPDFGQIKQKEVKYSNDITVRERLCVCQRRVPTQADTPCSGTFTPCCIPHMWSVHRHGAPTWAPHLCVKCRNISAHVNMAGAVWGGMRSRRKSAPIHPPHPSVFSVANQFTLLKGLFLLLVFVKWNKTAIGGSIQPTLAYCSQVFLTR